MVDTVLADTVLLQGFLGTLTANWITLMQAALVGTPDATVPITGEASYGFTSLQTGLLFIPILLPGLVLGPLSGRILDRQGPKTVVV